MGVLPSHVLSLSLSLCTECVCLCARVCVRYVCVTHLGVCVRILCVFVLCSRVWECVHVHCIYTYTYMCVCVCVCVNYVRICVLAQRPITLVLMMINSCSYSTNDLVFI